MSHKIVIEINLDNDAFCREPSYALSLVLQRLIYNLTKYNSELYNTDEYPLYDHESEVCGIYTITGGKV